MFINTLKHLNSIDLYFQSLPGNDEDRTIEDQTRNNNICRMSAIEEAEEIGCTELVLVLTNLLEDIFKTSDSEKLLNLKIAFREWMNKVEQSWYLKGLNEIFINLNGMYFNNSVE